MSTESTELRAEQEFLGMTAQIPPDVVLRGFVSETVVLNLDTGQYHALNSTGGRMIEALVEADTVADAAGVLAGEYSCGRDELVADLCRFCAELEQRGLIVLGDGA
jgi:Coenzyme PQQ synthesis protein D (PqqD)